MIKFSCGVPLAIATALLASSGASAALAADAGGLFAVRGIGGQGCETWIAITEVPDEAERRTNILTLQAWLGGYISAMNRQADETYDAVPFLDMVNVLAIVLNECRARPGDLAETTAARVVQAFSSVRVTAESPVVVVPDAGTEKPYRQATLALIQQRLVDKGFLEGTPDGVIGPGTTEAIRAYQADAGLPETGELSVDTVFQILLR